jgi:hypothetical protein
MRVGGAIPALLQTIRAIDRPNHAPAGFGAAWDVCRPICPARHGRHPQEGSPSLLRRRASIPAIVERTSVMTRQRGSFPAVLAFPSNAASRSGPGSRGVAPEFPAPASKTERLERRTPTATRHLRIFNVSRVDPGAMATSAMTGLDRGCSRSPGFQAGRSDTRIVDDDPSPHQKQRCAFNGPPALFEVTNCGHI